jgi:hypothetical protein
MTKKQFNILAWHLAQVEPYQILKSGRVDGVRYPQWLSCIWAVAKACSEVNSKFNTDEFIHACSYDYWKTHDISMIK